MPACGAKNCYVRSNRPLSQFILQPAPAAREQEGAESELAWLAIIFGSANAIRPMKPIIRIIGFARIIFTLNPYRHKHRSISVGRIYFFEVGNRVPFERGSWSMLANAPPSARSNPHARAVRA